METKITVVVDNISNDGIRGEWGLSILVQYNGKKTCNYTCLTGCSLYLEERNRQFGGTVKEYE